MTSADTSAFQRGETVTFPFVVRDNDGDIVNITGGTLTAEVWQRDVLLPFNLAVGAGITITNNNPPLAVPPAVQTPHGTITLSAVQSALIVEGRVATIRTRFVDNLGAIALSPFEYLEDVASGAVAYNVAFGGQQGPAGAQGPAGPAGATIASGVSFTPAGGIAATNVQLALQELDTEKAPLTNPTFAGSVVMPTQAPGDSSTKGATTAFTTAAIAAAIALLVGTAPALLDTLGELSDALADDANFAASVTASLAAKAPLASPTFTGTVGIPGTNKHVLFNDGGVLAGNAGLTFDKTTVALTLESSGAPSLRFRDSDASGYWTILAANFVWSGVNNHTFGINFNADLVIANMPLWAENWEPRYVDGAPPLGLLEKNWDYQSIDRSVAYRPFGFAVDLNTHLATALWTISTYSIIARGAANPTFKVNTASGATEVVGQLTVNSAATVGTGAYRLSLRGAPVGTVMLGITPTGAVAGDIMVLVTTGTITGDIKPLDFSGSVSGVLYSQARNTGAGGTHYFMWAGSGGDAWFRTLANVDWSFGVDRSDSGKWKLCNSDTLSGSDRITVTSAGLVTFVVGPVLIGAPSTALQGLGAGFYMSATTAPGGAFENRQASGSGGGSEVAVVSNDAAALASGDRLGGYLFGGSSSASALRYPTAILSFAAENWVDGSAYGARLEFQTTSLTTTTRATKAILSNAGLFALGATLANTVPALKPSAAIMQARLADDSGFTRLQAIHRTHQNAVAETPTPTHTIVIEDAAGQAYRVPCLV